MACAIDLFSRQVVGWSMQPHMQAGLVTDALRMAWFRRHPEPGLIFRSDRSSQTCSHSFQAALASYCMLRSMRRKGNCWDSAPTASLPGSLKVGRLYGKKLASQCEAMDDVIDGLAFYNHHRLHAALGYASPIGFEENWHAGKALKAALPSDFELRRSRARSMTRKLIHFDVSRSGLDRFFRRHGVSGLKRLQLQIDGQAKPLKTCKDYEPGFLHVDIRTLPQVPDEPHRRYLLVAIDRAMRRVFMRS